MGDYIVIDYKAVAESAAVRIAELETQLREVKSDLWWLVGGGEFAHEMESGRHVLCYAAWKEWEEARRHFPSLVAKDAADESQ